MADNEIDSRDDQDLDWQNRVLCSDESCIGVIGTDGRCKECGKPYEGHLPAPAGPAEASLDEAATDQPADDQAPPPPSSETPTESAADDDDWEKRTLCSDGSCIGVIGPDGRCKECGKPYAG